METTEMVNIYITNWKDSPFFEWEKYFDWAIFYGYVKFPEGTWRMGMG